MDNPSDNTLFTIDRQGNVLYSSRQLVTTACNMDLSSYPFDIQECRLDIESFSHKVDELLYHYKEGNQTLGFEKNIDIPHFTLLGHKLDETYSTVATGRYNRLLVKFYLKRDPQRYMHKYNYSTFFESRAREAEGRPSEASLNFFFVMMAIFRALLANLLEKNLVQIWPLVRR